MLKTHRIYAVVFVVCLLLSGCGGRAPASVLPMPTPMPETDVTVCSQGCDFTLIQTAIDAESTLSGMIIGVEDPVHTEGSIRVNKDVIVQGHGAQETIVQAHPISSEGIQRVFEIPLEVTVTIRGMTIRHGNPRRTPFSGGGVLNYGTLLLEDTVIRDNFGSAGGGIYNEGTLTLINSTISHNGSVGGGESHVECTTGGGIKVMSGTVTLINSTVSDNKAKGKGGGIHVACSGMLVLQNSTISGNWANSSGGAIYLNGAGEFINSTITNNNAHNVGGISIEGSAEKNVIRGQLSLRNTIIANNIGRLEKYGIPDCYLNQYGSIIVNEYSWIGDGNCTPTFSGDPMLGPLADNGGPTLTHSLLPDSPTIDIMPACTLDTDQRGEPRQSPCDIGAFEVQTP